MNPTPTMTEPSRASAISRRCDRQAQGVVTATMNT